MPLCWNRINPHYLYHKVSTLESETSEGKEKGLSQNNMSALVVEIGHVVNFKGVN